MNDKLSHRVIMVNNYHCFFTRSVLMENHLLQPTQKSLNPKPAAALCSPNYPPHPPAAAGYNGNNLRTTIGAIEISKFQPGPFLQALGEVGGPMDGATMAQPAVADPVGW